MCYYGYQAVLVREVRMWKFALQNAGSSPIKCKMTSDHQNKVTHF